MIREDLTPWGMKASVGPSGLDCENCGQRRPGFLTRGLCEISE